jgi:hypothetical protein
MKDFRILKLLDKFRFLFGRLGIDYKVMRKILQIKLMMDDRRIPTVMGNSKNAEEKSSFKKSLLLYGFIGLFIAIFELFPFPLFLKMNMVFGMIIFMVMTTMISDFSAVLLDIRDKNILQPRPISPQTINAAKLVHILIYLSSITAAIAGPSLIMGLFIYGFAFFCVFALELILICGFVVFFTSILYSAILAFFDGEKLKDIINYFQIMLSVFMVVAYQFIGRIYDIVQVDITYTPKWWNILLPSAWFAAPFNLFIEHSYTKNFIALSVTGLVIPAATLIIYITAVIPYFEKHLQKLNNSGRINKNAGVRESWQRTEAKLICRGKLEGAFFRFTQNMISNERKLKLKLYPSLAFAVVIPFVLLSSFLRRDTSPGELFAEITGGRYYLYIYMSIALLAASIPMLSTSEKYKGAWIYRALPITTPVPVLKGAVKSFILKYILPVYIFVGSLFIAIYGFKIILDIILMFLNMLLLILLIFRCSKKEMPFYKDLQYKQDGSNTGSVFLSFAVCGLLAAAHFFAVKISFGIELNILVSLLLTILFWIISFKITWKDVIKSPM